MTPRETFNIMTAIQRLAMVAYPVEDATNYPNEKIALNMGQIAGLCHNIKQECLDLDPSIRKQTNEQ